MKIFNILSLILFCESTIAFGQTLSVPGGYSNIYNNATTNVGIGINVPGYKLDVQGGGTANYVANFESLAGSAFGIRIKAADMSPTRYLLASYFSGTSPALMVQADGKVGIGISSPLNPLDVNGIARFRRQGSTTAGFTLGGDGLSLFGWGANNPYIEWINSGGTRQGYMGWNPNRLSLVLENGYNFTVEGGNVGIGNTNPDAKLAVTGQVHAQEVKVSVVVPGPDYVFEKNYKLPTLEELKVYINQNKHLPGVPTAAEMEKNGVLLGEMNMVLLKKVEELSLYVIELERRLKKIEESKVQK